VTARPPPAAHDWTTPRALIAQLQRRWDRGDLLRSLADGGPVFPLRLKLKGPDSSALSDRFEAVRAWAAELSAMPQVRIEWRELRHRVQGRQRLPDSIWIERIEDALALLGKRREAEQFSELLEQTRARQPVLLPWLARRPLQAIELAESWSRLIDVVAWVCANPRSGVYLRQVDIPGVHSKFIEAQRGVLCELLDLALPPDAIDKACSGIGRFAARYGFREKPARLRFRLLDPALRILPGVQSPDLTLDTDSFAALQVPLQRVFITENEINFLAFPMAPGSIVLFGAGYGWEALARAEWLQRCELHYWGDIDTHGFAILDQLRNRFPSVRSFLMDRDTLLAHAAHWGEESDPVRHALPRLTQAEHALYDALRDDLLQPRLRLEQERVGFGWLDQRLDDLLGRTVAE